MPRVDEIKPQTPKSALLKAGITQLSDDQHVTFHLYRRWVSPLDGMVYWVKALEGTQMATSALSGGLAYSTLEGGRSLQVVNGGAAAADIMGARIENPLAASDQGLAEAESLFVSLTGPSDGRANDGWTTELMPGDSFEVPPQPEFGAWVSTPTGGHKFSVIVQNVLSTTASTLPLTISQSGSLHYSSETKQEEDAVGDENMVVFTSKDEIRSFNVVGPDALYIGERDDIRFSFSSRGMYYEASDLWHYMGQALFAVNRALVIDDPTGWTPELVVSNSLPIWLSLSGYTPPYWGLVCPFELYPSFLAPDNALLPFGSVHVESTTALASVPTRGPRLQHDQLSKDEVRVTLYGASAAQAATFVDFVLQFIRNDCKMGLMQEMPIISDEKRVQPEYRILAQKKVVSFEVSYLQSVARDMARQIIKKAVVQFYPSLPSTPVAPQPLAMRSSMAGGM